MTCPKFLHNFNTPILSAYEPYDAQQNIRPGDFSHVVFVVIPEFFHQCLFFQDHGDVNTGYARKGYGGYNPMQAEKDMPYEKYDTAQIERMAGDGINSGIDNLTGSFTPQSAYGQDNHQAGDSEKYPAENFEDVLQFSGNMKPV